MSVCQEAVSTGKCAVLGLQSTGEARTAELMSGHGGAAADAILDDFVSTAAGRAWELKAEQGGVGGAWHCY